jgi:DNA-binding MarR family transcriptional regulator
MPSTDQHKHSPSETAQSAELARSSEPARSGELARSSEPATSGENSESSEQIGQELADIVSRLRRAMRRAARAAEPGLSLSVAQLELLSCIGEQPGVRPSQLARLLHLAPSSVATLLNTLQTAGYVTRTGGAGDRRTATLDLSAQGSTAVTRWQEVNEAIIGTALKALPPRSQAALQHSAPALRDLTASIDSLAD